MSDETTEQVTVGCSPQAYIGALERLTEETLMQQTRLQVAALRRESIVQAAAEEQTVEVKRLEALVESKDEVIRVLRERLGDRTVE